MKLTATTIKYDGIPRVVMIEFSGPGCDRGGYVMSPKTWESLEPVYSDKWDCIVEYRERDATELEYEKVEEVMREQENSD